MRKLSGLSYKFIYVYFVIIGLFHLYTSVFGAYESYLQKNIHLGLVLPTAFFLFPMYKGAPKDRVPIYDWILGALSAVPSLYVVLNYDDIVMRVIQVDPVTQAQFICGILLFVLLLEGTRRVVGIPLTLIAFLFAAYMYCGQMLPGDLKGLSFTMHEVVEQIYLTDEGIFSMPLGVSATLVASFLIFGGFLEKCGTGPFFMDVAQAFTGTAPGGPANIAVMSSCLFGSISGSAVANVYGTGTFTIPLMKKIGYAPHFAGAVEAVASSGGQIMPPVMGAGAFLMASFLGLPFTDIIIAALVPALLYYAAVFFMIRLEAMKNGLRGLSKEDLPDKREVLKKVYLFIPIVGLVAFLFMGMTPMRAAAIGAFLSWLVSLPQPENRMGPKAIIDSIYSGVKSITLVCVACATAGIVLASVSLTGVGVKLVGVVLALTHGIPLLALALVMIVSLILGMGLPTTGAYILASALGVPVLTKLGFEPLAAHLFVFYYAIISNITPHGLHRLPPRLPRLRDALRLLLRPGHPAPERPDRQRLRHSRLHSRMLRLRLRDGGLPQPPARAVGARALRRLRLHGAPPEPRDNDRRSRGRHNLLDIHRKDGAQEQSHARSGIARKNPKASTKGAASRRLFDFAPAARRPRALL